MCNGFQSLSATDRVLIKPNLVGWDNKGAYPPFGVLTTSRVLEEIIIFLKENGVKDIAITEASVTCKDIGSSTTAIFEYLGYKKWREKYGIKLIDLNKEKMKQIELEGHKINISACLDECDFLINVPVLKTHGTTVVSLGMKNLKGVMNKKSKGYFHHVQNIIDHLIVLLTEHLKPNLTIIDGIYALEKGPLHAGRAYRKNLVLASKDIFSVDAVGAEILGYRIPDVPHLKDYADRHQRATDLSDIQIVGDVDLDKVKQPLAWVEPWDEESHRPVFFAKQGLEGFMFPKVDHTMCTGCAYLFSPAMLLILSANKGVPFDDYEILTGKIMEPTGKANKTFLFGKCITELRENDPRINEAVPIKGCPPKYSTLIKTFREHGVDADPNVLFGIREAIMKRYLKDPAFDLEDYYLEGVPI
jgi:uncharacterized protein (DUF362 family)